MQNEISTDEKAILKLLIESRKPHEGKYAEFSFISTETGISLLEVDKCLRSLFKKHLIDTWDKTEKGIYIGVLQRGYDLLGNP